MNISPILEDRQAILKVLMEVAEAIPRQSDLPQAEALIFGDLHLPFQHPKAFEFLQAMKTKHNPMNIFCLGDLVDAASLSRYDLNPDLPNCSEELRLARLGVKALAAIFPQAQMCLGNHDERVARKASKAGISREMLKHFSEIYQLPEQWLISHRMQGNGFVMQHGHDMSGVNAAEKWRHKIQASIIVGHCHSSANIRYYPTATGLQFAAICPSLIDNTSEAFGYTKGYGGSGINGCIIIRNGMPSFEFLGENQ